MWEINLSPRKEEATMNSNLFYYPILLRIYITSKIVRKKRMNEDIKIKQQSY
jgi:hypothetical protein